MSGTRTVARVLAVTVLGAALTGCVAESRAPQGDAAAQRSAVEIPRIEDLPPHEWATYGYTPPAARAPSVRGYHALLAMGSRGLLLVGGHQARPRSGGTLQTSIWTLRDGKWAATEAELPFFQDVAVWDPDAARAVILTDVGSVYLYDPASDRWERRTTSGGPRAVDALRGAYDPRSRRVLVFGGADTWAYDVTANTWTQLSPRTSAPSRRWTAVAYHARSGLFVMFGGTDLADTWTYDPTANEWKERKPARAPSGRKYHAMAYDERADKVVLFGGAPGAQDAETPLGDTWIYDLARNEWTEARLAPAPTPRGWHAMAYDAPLGQVVLFGGGPHRDGYTAEMWVFDTTSSSWSLLTTSP